MREIQSGNTIMRIRASSLAIFFYKQEFKTDVLKTVADVCKDWMGNPKLAQAVKAGETEVEKILESLESDDITEYLDIIPDGYKILQITWALNKAQNVAEKLQTPGFEEWLIQNQDIGVMDIMNDVLEEAMQGFFRMETPGKLIN